MTWAEFDEFINRMETDLAAIEGKFEEIYKRLTNRVYRVIKTSVLDKLGLDDTGNVTLSDSNIALLTKLNKIIPGINVSDLLSEASDLFLSVVDISSPYFAAMTGEIERIDAIKAGMLPTLQRRAKIFKSMTPARKDAVRVRKSLLKSIAKGDSFKDIMRAFRQSPLKSTPLNHAKTELRDSFMEGDRLAAHKIAEGIGLDKYYRYTGGLVQRSRDFCESRNRKAFTRSEVLSWENKSWRGKSTPYDPFVNVGGYNCRHRLMPISLEMYLRLRGEKEPPKADKPTQEYTPEQVNRAKKRYDDFMQFRSVESYEPKYIGHAVAEQRSESHNRLVRAIRGGDKALEKKWKLSFLHDEVEADRKIEESKRKMKANKDASADILQPVKKLKKLGDFGKWLNTPGNPYRKQHFSKKYTKEAVDAYLAAKGH